MPKMFIVASVGINDRAQSVFEAVVQTIVDKISVSRSAQKASLKDIDPLRDEQNNLQIRCVHKLITC